MRMRIPVMAAACLLLVLSAEAKSPWKTIAPAGGRFRVAMPGSPSRRVRQLRTAEGILTQRIFSIDRGSTVYIVSYADHPQPPTAAGLSRCVQEWGRSRGAEKASLLSKSAATKSGYPAVMGSFVRGRFMGRCMAIAAGRRLYQVVFMARRDRGLPADGQRFLGSFRVMR